MQTLEEACRDWESGRDAGSGAWRKAWDDYYTYLAEHCLTDKFRSPQGDQVAAYLLKSGILRKGDSVLDIGCGSGSYAIPLAMHGASVTALDCNAASLALLQRRIRRLGCTDVSCVQAEWDSYASHSDARFDVAFAAMCPAISDKQSLLAMERLAARKCCILTVARGSYDLHRKAMIQELGLAAPGGMVTEALRYFDVLSLMGRLPDVKTWSASSESKTSLEDFLTRYIVYFRIFGMEDSASEAYLRTYFQKNAVDGILTEQSQLNLALLSWSPPGA